MATEEKFEGTEIKIKLLPRGLFKSTQVGKVVFTLTKEDTGEPSKAELTDAEKGQEIKIAAKKFLGKDKEQSEVVIEAPQVPDDEEFYRIKYHIEFKNWKSGPKIREGYIDYVVWPAEYVVEAVRKGDAAIGHSEGDPFAKVVFSNGEANDEGKFTFVPTEPGAVDEFGIKSPYYDQEWVSEPADGYTTNGRKRKVKVDQAIWTAHIRSPNRVTGGKTKDKALKQYVNLVDDKNATYGSLVKVTVGPEDEAGLRNLVKGQKINLRVTFDADISKRNDPMPAVFKDKEKTKPLVPLKDSAAKPGEAELVYEAIDDKGLEVKNDQEPPSFYIEMGYAGGTKCKVEVGVTQPIKDDTLYLESWRRLYYEILAPNTCEIGKGKDSEGKESIALADSIVGRLKTCCDPSFLEFVTDGGNTYKRDETAMAIKAGFMNESYFGGAAKDIFVLSDYGFTLYPKKPDKRTKPKMQLLKLCDRTMYNESGYKPKSMDITTAETEIQMSWFQNKKHFLGYSCNSSYGTDATYKNLTLADKIPFAWSAVKKIKWYAKVKSSDWDASHPGASTENTFTYGGNNVKGGYLLPQDVLELISSKKFKLKLPAGEDGAVGPGDLVNATTTDAKCPIKITMEVEPATNSLGLAGQGDQLGEILVVYDADNPKCTTDTLLHELGHQMKMTLWASGTFAAAAPPGIEMSTPVPEGVTYVGYGDSGAHCAAGISQGEKDSEAAKSADDQYFSGDGKCIMFGHGPTDDAQHKATDMFCEECTKVLSGRDLRSLG